MDQAISSVAFLIVYSVLLIGTFIVSENNRQTNIFRFFLILTMLNVLLYVKEVAYMLIAGDSYLEKFYLQVFRIRSYQVCIGVLSFGGLLSYMRMFIQKITKLTKALIHLYLLVTVAAFVFFVLNFIFHFLKDENNVPLLPDMTTAYAVFVAISGVLYFLVAVTSKMEKNLMHKPCFVLFLVFAVFDSYLQFSTFNYLYGVGSFIGLLLCAFFLQMSDVSNEKISVEIEDLSKPPVKNITSEKIITKKHEKHLKIYMGLCSFTMIAIYVLIAVMNSVDIDPIRVSTISGLFLAIELLIGIYMTVRGDTFGVRLAIPTFMFLILVNIFAIFVRKEETAFAGAITLFTGCLVVLLILTYMHKKDEIFNTIITQAIRTFSDMIDSRDKYTGGHSYRVSMYAGLIAEKLGYDKDDVMRVQRIGLLHDCGKLGISDLILNCEGKLSDEQYNLMKTHTTIGAGMLTKFNFVEGINFGALYHHERYDGKGYPQGLAGEEIPEIGRIICVADAFDAMNSTRCYRPELSEETILLELEINKGKQFDPCMAEIMIDIIKNEKYKIDAIVAEAA